jgi:hypothetical protein
MESRPALPGQLFIAGQTRLGFHSTKAVSFPGFVFLARLSLALQDA